MLPDVEVIFYRILRSSEPTLDDFKSNEALGVRPRRPLSGLALECWSGISVWETLQQASSAARRMVSDRRYVAQLAVSRRPEVRSRRTFRAEGHYTLWAEPEILLECVVSVVPIDPTR